MEEVRDFIGEPPPSDTSIGELLSAEDLFVRPRVFSSVARAIA